jgi:hypothetical protein
MVGRRLGDIGKAQKKHYNKGLSKGHMSARNINV